MFGVQILTMFYDRSAPYMDVYLIWSLYIVTLSRSFSQLEPAQAPRSQFWKWKIFNLNWTFEIFFILFQIQLSFSSAMAKTGNVWVIHSYLNNDDVWEINNQQSQYCKCECM